MKMCYLIRLDEKCFYFSQKQGAKHVYHTREIQFFKESRAPLRVQSAAPPT